MVSDILQKETGHGERRARPLWKPFRPPLWRFENDFKAAVRLGYAVHAPTRRQDERKHFLHLQPVI